jgi:hypothetical protein
MFHVSATLRPLFRQSTGDQNLFTDAPFRTGSDVGSGSTASRRTARAPRERIEPFERLKERYGQSLAQNSERSTVNLRLSAFCDAYALYRGSSKMSRAPRAARPVRPRRQMTLHFEAALRNLSGGLCMFDGEQGSYFATSATPRSTIFHLN